jgi:hypothetical protein
VINKNVHSTEWASSVIKGRFFFRKKMTRKKKNKKHHKGNIYKVFARKPEKPLTSNFRKGQYSWVKHPQ